MRKIIVSCLLGVSVLSVYACTSSTESKVVRTNSNSNNGSDSTMPKEFGSRFSSSGIKQEREAYYLQKLSELRRMSPSEKVKQGLQTNNIYLMEVPASRGGSRSFPGLVEPQQLTVNCRTMAAEGLGDVLYGKNHILYRKELLKFMREFNALMSPHCK